MDPDSQVKNSKWTFYKRLECKTASIEPEHVRIYVFCHHFSIQCFAALIIVIYSPICMCVQTYEQHGVFVARHVMPAL